MSVKFYTAPEVERIGHELISKNHQHLHINGVRVEFLFRDDEPKSGGQAVWGTARKVSGFAAMLANMARDESLSDEEANEPFFVITITAIAWDRLNDAQKRALVDHELMHCATEFDDDGELKLSIRAHDFEGFNEEIRRHGPWRENAQMMAAAMETHRSQAGLFDDEIQAVAANGTAANGVTISAAGFEAIAKDVRPKAVRPHKEYA